jgi:hypothetical protein
LRIKLLIRELAANPPDWNSFESILKEYATAVFRAHIKPYAKFDPDYIPRIEFLIALRHGDGLRLYRWDNDIAYELTGLRHSSIGVGTLQSESLIDQVQFYMSADQMLFFAVRVMLRVKQLVQGCGGKTEVSFLRRDGTVRRFQTAVIDALENLIEDADRFLSEGVLGFISSDARPENENALSVYMEPLRQFRDRYWEIIDGAPALDAN